MSAGDFPGTHLRKVLVATAYKRCALIFRKILKSDSSPCRPHNQELARIFTWCAEEIHKTFNNDERQTTN